MHSTPIKRSFAVLALTIGILMLGCGPEHLKSHWLLSSSLVQGRPDWPNLSAFRFEEMDGTLSIVNDSSALYIHYYSRDSRLGMRLRRTGFTVWLTNPNEKSERLGLTYPIGMGEEHPEIHGDRFLPSENLPPSQMANLIDVQNDDILITSGDSAWNGRKTVDEARQLGVVFSLVPSRDGIEYQLRVGLGQSDAWILPGSRVMLELDLPAAKDHWREHGGESGERGRHWGGGRGGGGPGGGEEGGEFHRGGRGERPRDSRPEGLSMNQAVHVRFAVDLAAGPAGQ